MVLLPVTISAEVEAIPEPTEVAAAQQTSSSGAIHIELPGFRPISHFV